MILTLAIYLLLFFFVGNSAIFVTVIYLRLRPHRSKIFISYSHKDTEVAERVMGNLSDYPFRIWIDLGIAISNDELEKQLSRYVQKRQIFLMLASKNSISSKWVQFELEMAKKPGKFVTGQWRDSIILALDEEGVQFYESLKEFYDELLLQYWAKELGKKEPREIDELAHSLEKVKEVGASQPFGRRVFLPMVTLIDFREPFELCMKKLTDHLNLNTQIGRVASDKKKRVELILFCFMLMTLISMIISGSLFLLLIVFT